MGFPALWIMNILYTFHSLGNRPNYQNLVSLALSFLNNFLDFGSNCRTELFAEVFRYFVQEMAFVFLEIRCQFNDIGQNLGKKDHQCICPAYMEFNNSIIISLKIAFLPMTLLYMKLSI